MNVDPPWMYVREMREAKGYCLWQFASCTFSTVRVEITLLLIGRAALYLSQPRKPVVPVRSGENAMPRAANVSAEKHRSARKAALASAWKWTVWSRRWPSVRPVRSGAEGRASRSPARGPAERGPRRLPWPLAGCESRSCCGWGKTCIRSLLPTASHQ